MCSADKKGGLGVVARALCQHVVELRALVVETPKLTAILRKRAP